MANTDAEKQERQKTVVAFIAGLLIGGLLVWVFSSSSATAPSQEQQTQDGGNTQMTDTSAPMESTNNTNTSNSMQNSTNDNAAMMDDSKGTTPSSDSSSLSVADQAAGTSVALGNVSFPTTDGWVVVRDYDTGVAGKILGAARYSTGVGLIPTSVDLLRATEAGKTYQVVFYTENGDRIFDTKTDVQIDGISATFTAK